MRNGMTAAVLVVVSGCLYIAPAWVPPPPPPELIECNSIGSCTAILHVDQDWLEVCWEGVPENERPPEVNACINNGLCDIPAGSFDFDMRGATTCVAECTDGLGNGHCDPAPHLSDALSAARATKKNELKSACPGLTVPMAPDEECDNASDPPFVCSTPDPDCNLGEQTGPDDESWMDDDSAAAMIAADNPALRFEGVLTSGSSVTLTRASPASPLTSSITGGVQLREGSGQLAMVMLKLTNVVVGSTTWSNLRLHARGSLSVNPATTPATITFDPTVTGGYVHFHGFENGVERLYNVSTASALTGTLDFSTKTWSVSMSQSTSQGGLAATLVGNVQDLP